MSGRKMDETQRTSRGRADQLSFTVDGVKKHASRKFHHPPCWRRSIDHMNNRGTGLDTRLLLHLGRLEMVQGLGITVALVGVILHNFLPRDLSRCRLPCLILADSEVKVGFGLRRSIRP